MAHVLKFRLSIECYVLAWNPGASAPEVKIESPGEDLRQRPHPNSGEILNRVRSRKPLKLPDTTIDNERDSKTGSNGEKRDSDDDFHHLKHRSLQGLRIDRDSSDKLSAHQPATR